MRDAWHAAQSAMYLLSNEFPNLFIFFSLENVVQVRITLARAFYLCLFVCARAKTTDNACIPYHTLRLSANSSCKHKHIHVLAQIHSQNNYFFADLNRLHFAICLCIYISWCCRRCCWIIAFFSFAVFYVAIRCHCISLCLSNRTSSIRVGSASGWLSVGRSM